MCLAAAMLSSCSNEDTVPAVVDPYNGHEYVDLGLSVKWATCNIGADKPEDYGDFFAWGATEPYYTGYTMSGTSVTVTSWKDGRSDGYLEANAPFYGSDAVYTTYTAAGVVLNPEHDAARANMGGDWRTPTFEEMQALCEKTTSTWTDNYKATGIFSGSSHLLATHQGYYWSSTLHNGSNGKYLGAVVGGSISPYGYNDRYFGFPVRAVFTVDRVQMVVIPISAYTPTFSL